MSCHYFIIGGGEIGRPGQEEEIVSIDKSLLQLSRELTGKNKSNLLFIPTASYNNQSYCDVVSRYFPKHGACHIRSLIIEESTKITELDNALDWADIVYVGGGNTLHMVNIWQSTGFDKVLEKFSQYPEKILSGMSAGAICWFERGVSDSLKISEAGRNEEAPFSEISALGLLKGSISPHMIREGNARRNFIRENNVTCYGLDDCLGVHITPNPNLSSW